MRRFKYKKKKKQGNRLFQAISDFPFASLLSPMLFNHFFVNSTFLMLLLLSLKLLLCEDLLLCFGLQIQRKKKTNIRFSELKQRQKQFRIIRTIILEPWNERRSRFVSLGDTKLDVNNGLALLRKSSDIDQRENEPARAYWNVLYFLLLTLIQQRKIEIWVSKADRLGPVG